MKNKILILILALTFGLFGLSTSSYASDPLAIGSTEAPSESFLSANRRSVGADTDIQTISAPTRGLNRLPDLKAGTWGNPFLPGGDGWELSETGNVGYPVGDASLPILLSMLVIYFIYRGVSSNKRKSTF